MDSYTPSLADLEARLAKLERQNRTLKRLGLLFLLIAGSGFLVAQAPRKPPSAAPAPATGAASYDTLVVHRLELRDKAGKLRGVWTAEDGYLGLALYDTAGMPRAELTLTIVGPALDLYDDVGKSRIELMVTADGPHLMLLDAAGKPRAALRVLLDTPLLGLYDGAGRHFTTLDQHGLELWGANPNVGAELSAGEFGPHLSLRDAQQFTAVVGVTQTETTKTGESHTTSAAAVTLFGKDGEVIWRAP